MKLVLGALMVAGVASLPKLTFRRTPNDPAPCALESDGQSIDSACALRTSQLVVAGVDLATELAITRADLNATQSELAILTARLDALEQKHTANLTALQQQHAADVAELEALKQQSRDTDEEIKDEVFKKDGGWTPWGTWGNCTAACDGGTRQRQRTCTSPSPERNGAACTGEDGQNYISSAETQTGACNTRPCEQDVTVTCEFTVDNKVRDVYVDGVDVTSQVSGALDNWPTVKTLTFSSLSRSLAIRCEDNERGCHNGGLAIKCSASGASGPGSSWNMDSSDRSKFSVASSKSWDTPSADSEGRPWYSKYYTENSRWGTPRSGNTEYADGAIGVADMCGPTTDSDENNKWWFRFQVPE